MAYAKCLFLLLLVGVFSEANADIIWPGLYVAAGMRSIWIIIGGLLVETGFVKYFTKLNWGKTVLVSVVMNLATGILGSILIAVGGFITSAFVDFVINPQAFVNSLKPHSYQSYTPPPSWYYTVDNIATYLLAIVINTIIECGVIRLMLKLKFKDTYKWVLVANAISIIMCAIYVAVADIK